MKFDSLILSNSRLQFLMLWLRIFLQNILCLQRRHLEITLNCWQGKEFIPMIAWIVLKDSVKHDCPEEKSFIQR